MPSHLHQKVLFAGSTFFFSIFCCTSIDLKAFHAFGRISFRWLDFLFYTFYRKCIDLKCFQAFGLPFGCLRFELKFLALAVSLSGNPKLWMRPNRFNTCNFCGIYLLNLLNNKELRMTSFLHQKVLYAGFTYFFSIFCCTSIDLKAFHAFGRISFRWLDFSF